MPGTQASRVEQRSGVRLSVSSTTRGQFGRANMAIYQAMASRTWKPLEAAIPLDSNGHLHSTDPLFHTPSPQTPARDMRHLPIAVPIAITLVAACGSDPGRTNDDDGDVTLLDTADDVGVDAPDSGSDAEIDPSPDTPNDAPNDAPDDAPDDADGTCTASRDCLGGQICTDGRCVDVCADDSDCADGVCDEDSGHCVECTTNRDCAGGEACENQTCVPLECEPGLPGCGPCLSVQPTSVDFGGLGLGDTAETTLTIGNCAEPRGFDLQITGLSLTGEAAIAYDTDLDTPFAIAPQDEVSLQVAFTPPQRVGRYTADLIVDSDGGSAIIPLSGAVVDASECPVADLACTTDPDFADPAPGPRVSADVGDTVYCTAAGSSGAEGIAGFDWAFTSRPDGAPAPTLEPNSQSEDVSFSATRPGEYTLELGVTDSSGTPSCFNDVGTIVVQEPIDPPVGGLSISLNWDTPGDLNPSDTGPSAGSDLDLLLRHPDGTVWTGSMFDQFVLNFLNTMPEWGPAGPVGNPSLDRDDSDGWGPENVSIDLPEVGVGYEIGINYFTDNGYGESTPTIVIGFDGEELGRWTYEPISDREFIFAGTLTLSNQTNAQFESDGTVYATIEDAP